MKKANYSEKKLHSIDIFNNRIKKTASNLIYVILALLSCQISFSKSNTEFKSNDLMHYSQTNDTVKKAAQKEAVLDEEVNLDLSQLNKVAEYPGGLEKFYSKIKSNFEDYDGDYDKFGKIKVSFTIEKDGSICAIEVNENSMDESMKKSIIEALNSIKTKWSPAFINNEPVKSGYHLSLVFN